MSSAAVAKTDKPVRSFGVVLLLAATLWGCVTSPIGYATPRTVEPLKTTHTIAVENVPDARYGSAPVLPTYMIRVGVHERIDIGLRILNGIDVKANAIRTRYFDASFNPRVQVMPFAQTGADSYVSMPIILGLNPTTWFSIVGSSGMVFAFRDKSDSKKFIEGCVGLDFRASNSFAIHPAMAFTRGLNEGAETHVIYGLGLTFGSLPVFE